MHVEVRYKFVDWIEVAQDGVQCQAILSKEMKFESYKDK